VCGLAHCNKRLTARLNWKTTAHASRLVTNISYALPMPPCSRKTLADERRSHISDESTVQRLQRQLYDDVDGSGGKQLRIRFSGSSNNDGRNSSSATLSASAAWRRGCDVLNWNKHAGQPRIEMCNSLACSVVFRRLGRAEITATTARCSTSSVRATIRANVTHFLCRDRRHK
jgi:hypothetical protein